MVMLKRVDVAKEAVEELMTKSVVGVPSVVVAAKMENFAYGEVVPRPRFPVDPSNTKGEMPAFPKRTVDDAKSPPWSWSAVPVAEVTVAA